MLDLQKIKRARLDVIQGQETIQQIEHIASAGAKLVMSGALVAGEVLSASDLTAAAASGGVKVIVGSVLRIQVSADTYVQFSNIDNDTTDSPLTSAPDATTSPALKLPSGYHIVVATGDFMRCSASPTRVEVVRM